MKNRGKVTNIFGHMQIYLYLCSRKIIYLVMNRKVLLLFIT